MPVLCKWWSGGGGGNEKGGGVGRKGVALFPRLLPLLLIFRILSQVRSLSRALKEMPVTQVKKELGQHLTLGQ